MRGTFETLDGEDIYDPSSAWYYAIQIILFVYGLGSVAFLVLIENANVVNTYTRAGVFGVLYSLRYVQLWWYALYFGCFKFLVFVFVCTMITFRKTWCCGRRGGCVTIWSALLYAVIMLEIIAFGILSGYYASCNGLTQVDNPCNDYRWCCAPEVYTNPANACDNSSPCTTPGHTVLSALAPNQDFVALFWVSFVFILFDLFFGILPFALWASGTSSTLTREAAQSADDALLKDSAVDDSNVPAVIKQQQQQQAQLKGDMNTTHRNIHVHRRRYLLQ